MYFPVGNAMFHVGNGMFSIGNMLFPIGRCYFPNGHFNFQLGKWQFPIGTSHFQIGKSSYSVGRWQLPIGAWSFPFVKCNVQWEEKTHIPVGNVIFELEVKRFIWEYNFLIWKCNFQFENQGTLLENGNLQLEQYRSEGCARTAYFLFLGAFGRGSVAHSRFRRDPARPDPARPGPARPDWPFRPDTSPIEKCRFGAVGVGPFRALPWQEFLPWGWSLSENHRFYKKIKYDFLIQ